MSDLRTDREFLLGEQYRTDENLRARIELHRLFSTSPEPWHRWVFDRLDIPADARVLELGTGRGELWRDNLDRVPSGWRLTLTDFSAGMIDAARESGVDADFAVVDGQDIPYADESFDAVIANHMLYHVPDRDRALSEIARVLVPGGHLYAATNGEGHLRELRELLPTERVEWSRSVERFGLESGLPQLERHFVDVEVEPFPDALEVTDPQPFVAFVRSLETPGIGPGELERIRRRVAAAIARGGSFRVAKVSGLFSCRKP